MRQIYRPPGKLWYLLSMLVKLGAIKDYASATNLLDVFRAKQAKQRSQMASETALAAPSPSQLGTLDIAGRAVGP